ncbi:nucleotidyltransferase domain-containing protein [Candidatus Woesearchaeota archaeon]|nr:nucleotidyltransferase domain-containing protein [Candidatus Woesearchaeota archaeon]
MDTYKLKFTRLQIEIFRILCIKTGEKLNQRNIAKLLKVSATAVAKSLPGLAKEGLVIMEKLKPMNLNLITLNRNNQKVLQLKRAENLKLLYESGLSDFLEEEFPGVTIILFGSYSRGDDTVNSDIDIAVIGREEKKQNLNVFEKMLERKINLNFYKSVREIHKDLRENLCNGIVLVGGIRL